METAKQQQPLEAAPSNDGNEPCCEIQTIHISDREVIRMTVAHDLALGELVRETRVVASARFGNESALRRWAEAMIDRAASRNADPDARRRGCLNCDD